MNLSGGGEGPVHRHFPRGGVINCFLGWGGILGSLFLRGGE